MINIHYLKYYRKFQNHFNDGFFFIERVPIYIHKKNLLLSYYIVGIMSIVKIIMKVLGIFCHAHCTLYHVFCTLNLVHMKSLVPTRDKQKININL